MPPKKDHPELEGVRRIVDEVAAELRRITREVNKILGDRGRGVTPKKKKRKSTGDRR